MLQSLLLAMSMVRDQVVALGAALSQCGTSSTRWYWGSVAALLVCTTWLLVKVAWTVLPPSLRCLRSPADV